MDERQSDTASAIAEESREAAESAGLVYVNADEPGIRRERVGDGFRYLRPSGAPVRDPATLERIRKLAIPPAWTDVWICTRASGHLQACGRDARGRKQYKYHPAFREVREGTKYERMLEFARTLPSIRETVDRHMQLRGLPREKVLATVVNLLETTLIRVGNEDYARTNKSYGLTTLRNPHVKVEGAALRFQFKGKSGKTWRLQVRDRRCARIVKACQELPGQDLFQYVDEAGVLRRVTSADVNAYLREITGQDITAKDFRTWAGTVLAACALCESESLKEAIHHVSQRLGNTPAICRKCYIHPEVIAAFQQGALKGLDLKTETEKAVLRLLEGRLGATLKDQLAASLTRARGK
jgi:DNA topoisomerase-1